MLYSQKGSYDKAVDYFFKALKKDKNNAEIYLNIGVVYALGMYEFEKGRKYLLKYTEMEPHTEKAEKIIYLNNLVEEYGEEKLLEYLRKTEGYEKK